MWGADITPDETPYEGGVGFCVKLDKEFLGHEPSGRREEGPRAALLHRARGPARGRARERAGAGGRRLAGGSRAAATATRSSDRSPTRTSRPNTPRRARLSRSRSSATGSRARSRASRSSTPRESGCERKGMRARLNEEACGRSMSAKAASTFHYLLEPARPSRSQRGVSAGRTRSGQQAAPPSRRRRASRAPRRPADTGGGGDPAATRLPPSLGRHREPVQPPRQHGQQAQRDRQDHAVADRRQARRGRLSSRWRMSWSARTSREKCGAAGTSFAGIAWSRGR